ncbi:WhiB family transcriptional regulator [Nonomuraea sp. NPDC003804]|uniref:WhiB family transcriptional regulator n=1 Tax=Nonomuraea sp. NPDC003804 TaxID=3154547 RepID=UPI00339E25B4
MTEWRWRAACREIGFDMFFPDESDIVGAEAAKQVCSGCRVRRQCLDWALATGEKHGVWGGKTAHERGNYQRALRRAANKEPVELTEKRCRLCAELRPIKEFGRNNENSDGYNSACKPCLSHVAQMRRQAKKAAAL